MILIPGNDFKLLTSYEPIYLLNILKKTLEKFLLAILKAATIQLI